MRYHATVPGTIRNNTARRYAPPVASYRLQLHSGFGFQEVRRLLPYLDALGISHLYLSPIFAAAPGSSHGYDVFDHNQINPELGGLAGLYELGEDLTDRDMGLILDIVPNHVGIAGGANPWWRDVLRYGRASHWASNFDIDWEAQPQLASGVLVYPILGKPSGAALEAGELRLEIAENDLALRYYEHSLPLSPATYPDIVGLPPLSLGAELNDPVSLSELVHLVDTLPEASPDQAGLLLERFRALLASEPEIAGHVQSRLDELNGQVGKPESFDRLDAIVSAQNYRLAYWRVAGEEINYRRFFDINDLAAIRVERHDVFEDIHQLLFQLVRQGIVTGVRVDHVDGLFEPAGYLTRLRELLREASARLTEGVGGLVSVPGLVGAEVPVSEAFGSLRFRVWSGGRSRCRRVSGCWGGTFLEGLVSDGDRAVAAERDQTLHPPRSRPSRLKLVGGEVSCRGGGTVSHRDLTPEGGTETRPGRRDQTSQAIPIYVEKILEEGERLPDDWPVEGTTGYELMSNIDGLMVDREGSRELTRTYERFVGGPVRFREVVYAAKRHITDYSFAGEINVLAMQLHRISRRHRLHRDNTLHALRNAIEATLSTFPVYRTYVVDGRPGEDDRARITGAIEEARRREPGLPDDALKLLAEVLLLERQNLEPDELAQRVHFRRRFEQLSAPVMAKGFEDTALYRYNRLVSLNEVGNDPSRFGTPPQEVHRELEERSRRWPLAMSASSTHDTKRSEDVRARLHVLSEVAEDWSREVQAWSHLNRRRRTTLHGEPVPDPNTEYLLYQTLAGSWPEGGPDAEYRKRLRGYLTKAMREMKSFTSWVLPDERYEAGCQGFLEAILDPAASTAFIERVGAFVEQLRPAAALNSLSALALKATAPGFPDFYQGTELWSLSLTDPDNRGPVDFEQRTGLLESLPEGPPSDLTLPEAKLWMTRRLLQVRASLPDLMAAGNYVPLGTVGSLADHVFAFARVHGNDRLVVAVPRLTMRLSPTGGLPLGDAWRDTAICLPGISGPWREELCGAGIDAAATVHCADLFAALPYAILTARSQESQAS